MEIPEIIIFNETKYRRMGGKRKYYLSQAKSNESRKKPKGLHVAIWEFYSGKKVKKGFHVHHKDGNTFNNDYSNLECISSKQHGKIPKNIDLQKARENLNKVRHLSIEWHKSEEGRKWHSENAKKSFIKRKQISKKCIYCNKKFNTKFYFKKYCDNKCAEHYRRKGPCF